MNPIFAYYVEDEEDRQRKFELKLETNLNNNNEDIILQLLNTNYYLNLLYFYSSKRPTNHNITFFICQNYFWKRQHGGERHMYLQDKYKRKGKKIQGK